MTHLSPPQEALESAPNALAATDQTLAERFEITRFRGPKFRNHEEDSSVVDSLSDCPEVMDVVRFFRECNK